MTRALPAHYRKFGYRALSLVLLLAGALPAADLPRLQTIDISEYEAPGMGRTLAAAMAISNDGLRIAVAMAPAKLAGQGVRIMLVETRVPVRAVWSRDLPAHSAELLQWSPDGKKLLAQSFSDSWVLDARDGSILCSVREQTTASMGFVSADWFGLTRKSGETTEIRLFRTSCEVAGERVLPYRVDYADADARAGLLALRGQGQTQVVQANPWKVVATIRTGDGSTPVQFFGNGRGFCSGGRNAVGESKLSCWDLQSEPPAYLHPYISRERGLYPVSAAVGQPWVAFVDAALQYNPFTELTTSRFQRWVIWDAIRGKVIGTVPAKQETGSPGTHVLPRAYRAVLSSSGRRFAIVGNGAIEIHAVESAAKLQGVR